MFKTVDTRESMSAILEKCFGESRWENVAGANATAMAEISGHAKTFPAEVCHRTIAGCFTRFRRSPSPPPLSLPPFLEPWIRHCLLILICDIHTAKSAILDKSLLLSIS